MLKIQGNNNNIGAVVFVGKRAVIEASPISQFPVVLQWSKNGVNISGATNLFYEIPTTGENSHTTLVERSSEYLGLDLNLLLEQLNFLQEQNKLLQQQINEFNTNI